MQGRLLIDKPAGWTSFDVVNYIRRIVATHEGKKPKNCKVGHTGTLDPFATGLLVLLVGKEYTRKAMELTKLDKTYEMTMRLGETSTTGDPEGTITKYNPDSSHPSPDSSHPSEGWAPNQSTEAKGLSEHGGEKAVSDTAPTEAAVLAALQQFRGQIEQVPPAFSAIKVNGQRAYKLAREGKEVIIAARPTTIYRLELISYNYPEVKLVADVSSGTYIRTLVEDIGKALDTGAYTTQLRRTRIADFDIKYAIAVDGLTPEILEKHLIQN